jgi:hypothetical protein
VAQRWETLDRFASAEGEIELRRRGAGEFLITVAGRVLMNSAASRSETALAHLACAALGARPSSRALIGRLDMGIVGSSNGRAWLAVLPEPVTSVLVTTGSLGLAVWRNRRGPENSAARRSNHRAAPSEPQASESIEKGGERRDHVHGRRRLHVGDGA